MPNIHTKNKLYCPMCDAKMVKALTDTGPYYEPDMRGEIVEVVHVYYGCTNDEICGSMIRLRYRKDGQTGDLWKMVQAKRANGHELVTELPGSLKEMVDL